MALTTKKVTPRQIAERFLINGYIYSNIKVNFGFDEWACEYTLFTAVPISYTGDYCIVFLKNYEDHNEVIHYAAYLGNDIVGFIEKEIINFMNKIHKSGKITICPTFYFDDERMIKRCKKNEYINPI